MTTQAIQQLQCGLDLKAVLESILATATSSTTAAAVQTDLDATEATIITDLGALRTAHNAIATALDTLAAKLNADAGVTDTNYATNNVAANSAPAVTTA